MVLQGLVQAWAQEGGWDCGQLCTGGGIACCNGHTICLVLAMQ